jgi:hypothetical protein
MRRYYINLEGAYFSLNKDSLLTLFRLGAYGQSFKVEDFGKRVSRKPRKGEVFKILDWDTNDFKDALDLWED